MPAVVYRLKDGTRCPSVTTINRIGQDPGGLIAWAWQCGIDGLDYRKVRDDAAKAGEIGHKLVESAIKKTAEVVVDGIETPALIELARNAFAAYQRWNTSTNIKWLDSELSLVSEHYRFGGTIDAIGLLDGANTYCLGDWKTGALYPEHLCQVAAYAHLFEECTGHAISGVHLCRFNKLTGDFTHHYTQNLEDAWQAFLLKRELYDRLAQLKKRI